MGVMVAAVTDPPHGGHRPTTSDIGRARAGFREVRPRPCEPPPTRVGMKDIGSRAKWPSTGEFGRSAHACDGALDEGNERAPHPAPPQSRARASRSWSTRGPTRPPPLRRNRARPRRARAACPEPTSTRLGGSPSCSWSSPRPSETRRTHRPQALSCHTRSVARIPVSGHLDEPEG